MHFFLYRAIWGLPLLRLVESEKECLYRAESNLIAILGDNPIYHRKSHL